MNEEYLKMDDKHISLDERHFTSKYNKNKILDQLFERQHKGIFIEVGGWDGYELSNTYFMEKMRDWTGILVEPIIVRAEEANKNRWCKVVNACVGKETKQVDFCHIQGYSEMLSAIKDSYHPTYNNRVLSEIQQHGQHISVYPLDCYTINDLMDKNTMKSADYLSLDTQSSELEVLQVYNVEKNPIKVIGLDTNSVNENEIKTWFAENGYVQYWKHGSADDYLFINHSLSWSWE